MIVTLLKRLYNSPFLFSIIIIIIGIRGLYFTISSNILIFKSKDWIHYPAIVVSARLNSYANFRSTSYNPKITYKYMYNGMQYINDKFTIPEKAMGKLFSVRIVKAMQKNKHIKIFINPNNANQSVIIKPKFEYILTLFLTPLSFLLVYLGIFILKKSR